MGLIATGLVTRGLVSLVSVVSLVGVGSNTTTGTTSTYDMSLLTTGIPGLVGDLIVYVAFENQFGGAGQYWTPPAGWTELKDQGTPNPIASVGWRRITASDSTTNNETWTSTASGSILVQYFVYRNAAIDVVGAFGTSANTTATITIPGVTTTAPNTVLQTVIISTGATTWSGTIAPAASRTVTQTNLNGSASLLAFAGNQVDAGATGNITTNFSAATGSHSGILIALKPL